VPKPHAVRLLSVYLAVKPVGKPDAGNRHVRFDERGWETGRCRMAQATAPILDSTFSDIELLQLRCEMALANTSCAAFPTFPNVMRYGGNPSSIVRAARRSAVAKPSVNRS
jgi:hypothetical protein